MRSFITRCKSTIVFIVKENKNGELKWKKTKNKQPFHLTCEGHWTVKKKKKVLWVDASWHFSLFYLDTKSERRQTLRRLTVLLWQRFITFWHLCFVLKTRLAGYTENIRISGYILPSPNERECKQTNKKNLPQSPLARIMLHVSQGGVRGALPRYRHVTKLHTIFWKLSSKL